MTTNTDKLSAHMALTDDELTVIYRKANGEDVGKAQPLTTQRIFRAMRAVAIEAAGRVQQAEPVDVVLFCPSCGKQHVDKPEGQFYPGHTANESVAQNNAFGLWDNPPHRSHLCHVCGCVWRPADVPTNGVEAVKTKGKADTWIGGAPFAAPAESAPAPTVAEPMRTHVEEFATKSGWNRSDGEGAFEFIQRKCYHQGWQDGRREALGDVHRDTPEVAAPTAQEASKPDYDALEREHMGDFEKKTGIYAEAIKPVQAEAPSDLMKLADEYAWRARLKDYPATETARERLHAKTCEVIGALHRAIVIIDGALYRGHELNATGEEKLQAIRNIYASAISAAPPAQEQDSESIEDVKHAYALLFAENARLRAAIAIATQPTAIPAAPAVQASGERPTVPGLYAWVPEHGSPSIVLVGKRPSAHCDGGILNGQVIESSKFYDGCAMTSWPATGWVNLEPAQAALASPPASGEKP